MKKYLSLLLILVVSNGYAQTNPADTVKRISLNDLREFNSFAAKNFSYEDYSKMKVEEVIQQLWIWSENRKKQVAQPQQIKK